MTREKVLERRLSEPSCSASGKLRSAERYRELGNSGAFEFPPLRADIELDTGVLSPREAAPLVSAGLATA
jgi:hypothetical protein